MPFFQNVTTSDFQGVWVLGDRQYSLNFKCPLNAGRGSEDLLVWTRPSPTGTYDLSGNDVEGNDKSVLNLVFAMDVEFKTWCAMTVDIAGAVPAATTPKEIVDLLNADARFADYFTASLKGWTDTDSSVLRVTIKQKLPSLKFRCFVENHGAETVLRFNARAGIKELPLYFHRHEIQYYFTLADRVAFTDGTNILIQLTPASNDVHAAVIDNAVDFKGNSLGYSSATVQADWQLLKGQSGLFTFKKQIVNGSSQVTSIIEYPAGAKVGDFAKKTLMTYTGAQTHPDKITEQPYVLTSGDLVTP